MNIKGDSKKAWAEINRKKNSKTPIPDVIETATGSVEISDFWRDHYTNLFNDVTHPHPSILPQHVAADAPAITVNEVEHAIKLLNSSSSAGNDGITPHHVSCAHPIVYVLLTLLYNICLRHSTLPNDLLRGPSSRLSLYESGSAKYVPMSARICTISSKKTTAC